MKRLLLLSFLLMFAFSTSLHADLITATLGSSGTISEGGVTSGPNASFTTGHLAGPDDTRGFFEMLIPAFTGTVNSATITLNTREVSAGFNGSLNSMSVYSIGNTAPTTFADVMNGTVIATPNPQVPTSSLQSFSFNLNSNGISAIQSLTSGGSFHVGLRLGGVEANSDPGELFAFGFHSGAPLNSSASLQFETSAAAVPEPSSFALFAIGGVCFFAYSRHRGPASTSPPSHRTIA